MGVFLVALVGGVVIFGLISWLAARAEQKRVEEDLRRWREERRRKAKELATPDFLERFFGIPKGVSIPFHPVEDDGGLPLLDPIRSNLRLLWKAIKGSLPPRPGANTEEETAGELLRYNFGLRDTMEHTEETFMVFSHDPWGGPSFELIEAGSLRKISKRSAGYWAKK